MKHKTELIRHTYNPDYSHPLAMLQEYNSSITDLITGNTITHIGWDSTGTPIYWDGRFRVAWVNNGYFNCFVIAGDGNAPPVIFTERPKQERTTMQKVLARHQERMERKQLPMQSQDELNRLRICYILGLTLDELNDKAIREKARRAYLKKERHRTLSGGSSSQEWIAVTATYKKIFKEEFVKELK